MYIHLRASLVAQWKRIHLLKPETWIRSLGQEDPLEEEMAGKSRGQRSLVRYSLWDCKRVGHDLVTKQQRYILRPECAQDEKSRQCNFCSVKIMSFLFDCFKDIFLSLERCCFVIICLGDISYYSSFLVLIYIVVSMSVNFMSPIISGKIAATTINIPHFHSSLLKLTRLT